MSHYHVDAQGKNYRTDCSGFVSMAWHLSTSLTTATLPGVSIVISKDQLLPGDVLIKQKPKTGGYGHTLIFEKWANPERTSYWAYEQHGPDGSPTAHRIVQYPYFKNDLAYIPHRYKSIQ